MAISFSVCINCYANEKNNIASSQGQIKEKIPCDTPPNGFPEIITRSRMINAQGGKIEVTSVMLTIPANAVKTPTLVTFTRKSKNSTNQTFVIKTNPAQIDNKFAKSVTLSTVPTNKNQPSSYSIKTDKLNTPITIKDRN